MNYIPQDLLIDIVRRVEKNGFRLLGPLVASGPDGMALAFHPTVLREVDIDEFIFVSTLAAPNSGYRHILLRCLEAGNITAKYVVGLRLAALSSPSQLGIDLLAEAAPDIIYARFALAAFLICCGSFDQGMEVVNNFFNLIPTIEEAVGIVEMVVSQVRDMTTTRLGLYDNTLRFGGGLPHCFLNNYSVLHLCKKCFAFMYATRIQDLC